MTGLSGIKAGGYLPASFLDWDGRISAVVFCCGCNFRCPWCHNSTLVLSEPGLLLEDIFSDIMRRSKFLDGVVVSGGEPTLWRGFLPLLENLKEAGIPAKADTNGSVPALLREVTEKNLAAHIAMDIKAPLDADAYSRLAGVPVGIEKIIESVELIKAYAPSYEFRTTYVPALHTVGDLLKIRRDLSDDAHWVVQCFKPEGCLDEEFKKKEAASAEKLKELLPGIKIRG